MDTTKTMRQLCADEPKLEAFLQSKGFPFSLDNPIVDLVTFEDVCQVRSLDRDEFLGGNRGGSRVLLGNRHRCIVGEDGGG